MDTPLVKKLLIKPGHHIWVRNAPPGYLALLDPLPEGTIITTDEKGPFDVVLHFVSNRMEVDAGALADLKALKAGGVLWMAYPKQNKALKTDINRDSGWDALWNAGWVGIGIIAIDETWAGLRFRPAADVKRKPDSMFLK